VAKRSLVLAFLVGAVAAPVGLVAACHGDGDEPPRDAGCTAGYVGDRDAAIEMDLLALGPDSGTSMPVDNGSTLSLDFPPQGGRVVFVGARANNLDPCGVVMIGTARDPASGQVRTDMRTVTMAKSPADGWATSSDDNIYSFANVPICPNQWSESDAFGVPYEWTLELTDRHGKMAKKTFHAAMGCFEPAHLDDCLCTCKKGYVLGQHCDRDAAVPADANPTAETDSGDATPD
jgi:hypothetical protein